MQTELYDDYHLDMDTDDNPVIYGFPIDEVFNFDNGEESEYIYTTSAIYTDSPNHNTVSLIDHDFYDILDTLAWDEGGYNFDYSPVAMPVTDQVVPIPYAVPEICISSCDEKEVEIISSDCFNFGEDKKFPDKNIPIFDQKQTRTQEQSQNSDQQNFFHLKSDGSSIFNMQKEFNLGLNKVETDYSYNSLIYKDNFRDEESAEDKKIERIAALEKWREKKLKMKRKNNSSSLTKLLNDKTMLQKGKKKDINESSAARIAATKNRERVNGQFKKSEIKWISATDFFPNQKSSSNMNTLNYEQFNEFEDVLLK